MKQAMNAVQTEIDTYGQTAVVSVLVGGRFLIAAIALFIGSSKARAALRERELWGGGTVLGLILLVGFTTQMVGIDCPTKLTKGARVMIDGCNCKNKTASKIALSKGKGKKEKKG